MARGKPEIFCTGRSKTSGEPCRQAPVPFGSLCRWHGGLNPQRLAEADAAYDHWLQWGSGQYEAPLVRAAKIRAKQQFDTRLARHNLRKTHTEAEVNALIPPTPRTPTLMATADGQPSATPARPPAQVPAAAPRLPRSTPSTPGAISEAAWRSYERDLEASSSPTPPGGPLSRVVAFDGSAPAVLAGIEDACPAPTPATLDQLREHLEGSGIGLSINFHDLVYGDLHERPW